MGALVLSLGLPPLLFPRRKRKVKEKLGRRLFKRLLRPNSSPKQEVARYLKQTAIIQWEMVWPQMPIAAGIGLVSGLVTGLVPFGLVAGGFSLATFWGYLFIQDWNLMLDLRTGGIKHAYRLLIENKAWGKVDATLVEFLESRKLPVLETTNELLLQWGSETSVSAALRFTNRPKTEHRLVELLMRKIQREGRALKRLQTAARTGDLMASIQLLDRADAYFHLSQEQLLFPEKTAQTHELEQQLARFETTQRGLRAAPGEAFCTRCHIRPESRPLRDTQYLICPECGQIDALIPDVRKVVGVIGPTVEGFEAPFHYHVALWDAEARKTRLAQVDEIVVRDGADFNYDWAVAAVIEALRNRFPSASQQLSYEVSPSLELSPNSRNLLLNN